MNRAITLSLVAFALSLIPILSWAAEPNAEQARAITEIKKLGGKVTVDKSSPGEPVISVDLQNRPFIGPRVTDAGLVHLKGLTTLRTLNLSKAYITDAGLENLKGLSQLESLTLRGTQVTDTGLAVLKGLANLQSLDLGG